MNVQEKGVIPLSTKTYYWSFGAARQMYVCDADAKS